MIALSITPEYLVQIGLLDPSKVPSADKDIGLLLRQAMDKVAFLPFGLLVDRYRWGVFDGRSPAEYNTGWTDLRLRISGHRPAGGAPGRRLRCRRQVSHPRQHALHPLLPRAAPAVPVLQGGLRQAGWKGPLHRCSFYGNKEVGAKLNAMLEMGASKPWPDALEAFTGSAR
jgi:peptidyl-dipeptidase A